MPLVTVDIAKRDRKHCFDLLHVADRQPLGFAVDAVVKGRPVVFIANTNDRVRLQKCLLLLVLNKFA